MNKLPYYKVLILLVFTFFGCKKKISGPEWETEILTPILHTSLSVSDLLDSTSIESDNQSFLSIVYSDEIYSVENPLDSLVSLSIDPYQNYVTLQTLQLNAQNISDTTFLGDLFDELSLPITPSDGSNFPVFFLPLINASLADLTTLNSDIDISSFLEEAYPQKALLDINIDNHTDFDIVGLTYEIKNSNNDKVLVEGVIDTVFAQSIYTDLDIDLVEKLEGEPVEGNLSVVVGNFTLAQPEGQNIVTRYDDYLSFGVSLHDLKVLRATAQFPAQEVVNHTDIIDVHAEGDVELTYALIRSGRVNVRSYSSMPIDVSFQYSVPNMVKDEESFFFISKIDDTYNSVDNQKDTNFVFDDYAFDFTINTDTIFRPYNAFLNTIVAEIEETEELIELSLEDTISVEISIPEIKPSFVKGYLGTTTYSVQDTVTLETDLGSLKGIDFSTVNFSLEVENELGIDATFLLNELIAINSETGQQVVYSGNKGPFPIERALLNGDSYTSVVSLAILDNANDMLAIGPDLFYMDLDFVMNPIGNTGLYDNFMHSGASIAFKLNVDIPLEASISNLELNTSTEIELSTIDLPDGFTEGDFMATITNGFPVDAVLDLYFTDEFDVVIDSLKGTSPFASGILDPVTQIVSEPTVSTIKYPVSRNKAENILNATKVQVITRFSTTDQSEVKFYDYYSIDIQLAGDFDYHINKK